MRNKIFREIVANLIVHREYVNAQPCSFTIYADRIETVNANNPHGDGVLDPNNFAPFTKNPAIAKFFIQLGRGDELGSGVINVNRLIKSYSKAGKVQFIEGEVFKTIIPFDSKLGKELIENINKIEGVNDTVEGIIAGAITGVTTGVIQKLTLIVDKIQLNEGLKTNDIANLTGIPARSLDKYIKQLRDASLIEFKGSSKTGGYYLTDRIKEIITTK